MTRLDRILCHVANTWPYPFAAFAGRWYIRRYANTERMRRWRRALSAIDQENQP